MARISRINQARGTIVIYLSTLQQKVFASEQIDSIITEKRQEWDLPTTSTNLKIAQQFVELDLFKIHEFELSNGVKILRYFLDSPTIYETAASLKAKSYISHYPAVFLNQLTNQVPKAIYTTFEQGIKQKVNQLKDQSAIDKAFAQPQRRSDLTTEYDGYSIVLLNGRYTNRQGIFTKDNEWRNFYLTNLERTLIDITVRPNYAGGCFAVLEAYKRAQNEKLSINKLLAYLDAYPFTYPYQQAIGFYLERAGYEGKFLDRLTQNISPFQFYLDYEINDRSYSSEWKIYYPKGM